jgi:hypothetical protein
VALRGMSSRYDVVAFFLVLSSSCLFLVVRRSLVSVCWRQELEHRARDRYGALAQMSAELRQLREQRDVLDALAKALRTRDGWLAYRAEARVTSSWSWRGNPRCAPLPSSGFARPSSTEMRRCSRRERTWRGRAPWRLTGRQRWSSSGPRTGRSARSSRRHGLGEAGPRRGRGRPSRRPRKPKS